MVQIKRGETLSGKDRIQFIKDVTRARNDPVWFAEEKLGLTSLFPKQKEVLYEFYRHLYKPGSPEYKKLVWVSGQRCLSGETLIATNHGLLSIRNIYEHSIDGLLVYNGNKWVKPKEVIYAGKKDAFKLTTEYGFSIECSKDHKFYVYNGEIFTWKRLEDIEIGIDCVQINKNLCIEGSNQILIDNYSWLYKEGSSVIDQLIDPNKTFVMVKTIEDLGKSIDMYDLHVPEGNCYVANGMLVHNSGKTVLASIILCYEFFYLMSLENPAEHFGLLTLGHGKSQPIACTCVAVSSDQAKDGVYTLARNYMEGNEWFEQWWPNLKFRDDRIDLPEKNIFMQVKASRMDSAAGFTNKIVVFDELDLFAKTDSKMGARMVYDKLVNSTQTFKHKGKVVAISSLQGIDGIMSELYNNGQFEDTTLTYKLESWVANPNLSKELLMEEYKYRMDAFWRDFANRPEVSTGVVFPGKVRLNKRIPNVFLCDEIPEEALYFSHALACDPAYRNDAFGMAVGYVNDNHIIIDGVNKFQKKDDNKAYINPSDIENYIFEWIPKLNVDTFLYDTDLILPTVEKLENEWGINCVKHIAGEDAYSTWVNLNDDVGEYTLDIVYDEYLEREANQLIKKELPSGKIKYDHVYNSSKDVADCCANLIWYLANNKTSIITNPVIPGFATF